MHVPMPCRTPLDVMRVDMGGGWGHRYAVCVASYGYMGDLMAASERLRCLGPARYSLAGAWTLLRGAAYDAQVRPVFTLLRSLVQSDLVSYQPGGIQMG